ncbi:SPOSA6832_00673, partial [Sporobolomyces salmonicolor]
MASSFFRGTSTDQDPRFKDKQAMLLKKMQFPPSFDQKVDMRKVEIAVMKPWIAKKTVELLGFEDDVLIEYINSLLEDTDNPIVDAKNLQVLLTGFLEKKTPTFMESLWTLLLSAQSNPLRVPTELLEEKKREMRERETQEAIKRRQAEQLDEVRRREREGRAGPGGGVASREARGREVRVGTVGGAGRGSRTGRGAGMDEAAREEGSRRGSATAVMAREARRRKLPR